MAQEFSAGIVVFYEWAKKREYLLLQYEAGHWDFAKGHIEHGETKEEAALRELQEETGLTTVKIIPEFHHKFSYFYKQPKTGTLTKKTVYFFIGKSRTKKILLSFEHINFIWLPFKQALAQLTYDNAKELLVNVEQHLKDKKK